MKIMNYINKIIIYKKILRNKAILTYYNSVSI